MPLPSVWLMLLFIAVNVSLGFSHLLAAHPSTTPLPPPIPFDATVLLATMTLLFTVAVIVAKPWLRIPITVPRARLGSCPGKAMYREESERIES